MLHCFNITVCLMEVHVRLDELGARLYFVYREQSDNILIKDKNNRLLLLSRDTIVYICQY